MGDMARRRQQGCRRRARRRHRHGHPRGPHQAPRLLDRRGHARRPADHRRQAVQRVPLPPGPAAPDRGPVMAAPDHHDARPPAHPAPARGTAVHGWLARRPGRLRRVRLHQPRRRGSHPPDRLEPRRGVRQHRGHGLGPGNAGLVRAHQGRLPGSPRRRRNRSRGRSLLERLPYPENLDNHFAVDPSKWDFYSMDCYRILGSSHDASSTENRLAESYAAEVIRLGTDSTGTERSPMRNAEARVTLGVIAARQSELEQALGYGRRALTGERLSLPSLLMVSSELATVVRQRYNTDADAVDYLDQLKHLRSSAA